MCSVPHLNVNEDLELELGVLSFAASSYINHKGPFELCPQVHLAHIPGADVLDILSMYGVNSAG